MALFRNTKKIKYLFLIASAIFVWNIYLLLLLLLLLLLQALNLF